MRRPRTIRSHLLLGYAIIVVLVASLLMGITFLGVRARAQEQSAQLMRRAMRQTKKSLDGFFGPVARSAALVRRWAAVGALRADDPAGIRQLVRPMLLQIEDLSWVEVADDRGRRVRLSRTAEAWQLWQSAPGEEIRAWRWTFDEDVGDALGPPGPPPLEALAWRNRAEGLEMLAPEEGIVWEQAEDPASPWGSLAADGWYRTADGRAGMVALGVDLDTISDFTRGLQPTQEALAMVLIESGESGGAPIEVIGLPDLVRFEREKARLAARGKSAGALGVPVIDDALDQVLLRRRAALEAPISFRSDGEIWWLDTDEYKLGTRALYVVILIPQVDLLGDRTALRWWILVGALLALLLSLALAFRFARRAEAPLQALVEETERFRRGDFDEGPAIETNVAEFRQLARAHDEMREDLRNLVQLERDMEVAREIQQATIPDELPQVPGYRIAGSSVPADRTGGDTFDVIGVRDVGTPEAPRFEACLEQPSLVLLLLADATGHGVGPALSVTQLRAMGRTAVWTLLPLPELARRLNEQLRTDLPEGRFVSAWFGQLDPQAHRITALSAGQGPIWHYRAASDTFESPGTQMPPVGLFPDPPIEAEVAIDLAPGDLFLVLSDGFHETLSPAGEVFGEERVQALIREYAAEGPEPIIEALTAAVEAFAEGAPADDDRTLLVIQRLA